MHSVFLRAREPRNPKGALMHRMNMERFPQRMGEHISIPGLNKKLPVRGLLPNAKVVTVDASAEDLAILAKDDSWQPEHRAQ